MTLQEAEAEYEAAKAERDAANKRNHAASVRLQKAERALGELRDLAEHQKHPAAVWIDRPFGVDVDDRVYSVAQDGAIVLRNRYRYLSRYNQKTGYLYGVDDG